MQKLDIVVLFFSSSQQIMLILVFPVNRLPKMMFSTIQTTNTICANSDHGFHMSQAVL